MAITAGQLLPYNGSPPANDAIPVTPNDGADLATPAAALLIGTAGNLRVITGAGVERTLTNVPAGMLPLNVKRVYATGTTASDITALIY